MADILIRGMEMPKERSLWFCIRTDGAVYNIKPGGIGTAHAIGTAVPIPAGHGRLIDADALLLDAGEVCEVWGDGFTISGFSREQIENAPTIIDADLEWKMRNCCCFSNDQKEGGTDDG